MTDNASDFLMANQEVPIIRIWRGPESTIYELEDRRTFILSVTERESVGQLNWGKDFPAAEIPDEHRAAS